jgi:putative hemolysin
MRRRGEEIAAVVDEHGAYDGIVAIEDAAEQVVGEIIDIHDLERFRVSELDGGEIEVSAQMEIGVFNTLLGANLHDPDVETLGGLVCKRLGRVAQAGESLEIGGHRLTVAQAEPRRVVRLRVARRGLSRRRTERR